MWVLIFKGGGGQCVRTRDRKWFTYLGGVLRLAALCLLSPLNELKKILEELERILLFCCGKLNMAS